MKRLRLFLILCGSILSGLSAAFASGSVPGPIHLAALLDTNPSSNVAFLRLTGSELNFVITPPTCSIRLDIVANTNGILSSDAIFTISADLEQGTNGPHMPPLPCSVPPPNNSCNPRIPKLPATITNSVVVTPDQMKGLIDGLSVIAFRIYGRDCAVTARIVVLDTDCDGVLDLHVLCPGHPAGSLVNSDGCSIDQLAPCDGDWRNHGEFVRYFHKITSEFQAAGLISGTQARELNRACAQSDCGK